MFKTDELKALVSERLLAAAEEIFCLFEKTLKDYEEALLFRSKQKEDSQSVEGFKAPLEESFHEYEAASKQNPCDKTDLCESDLKPLQIKVEEIEDLWSQTCETQEKNDTKDAVFNIVYVQKKEEEQHTHGESSSEFLKVSCDAPELTSDCQASGESNDQWRNSNLKTVEATETSGRPYSCNVCKKTFKIKSILTRHMKTHTGEKPHSCSVCGKNFIQRSSLQTHMNCHTGQKPYKCRFCGRGFTQVGHMNAHVRIHTGEKPHSCHDCGRSFREKSFLIKHRIIHTGENPYSCSVCDIKFSTQSSLVRHMKTHSGERPFSCVACGKRFIRHSQLISHMKTHAAQTL